MDGRYDRTRARKGKRRRRVFGGLVKLVFWILVLAATFILGLGFGRTIAGDDEVARKHVTITQDRGAVTATLPTRTITTTKTVTVTKRVAAAPRAGARRGAAPAAR